MTTMAPDAVNESLDPRDPLLRLSTFFDDGTVELLHERDRSGVLAGAEALNGLLLIGWSASYLYIAMERFWNDQGAGREH